MLHLKHLLMLALISSASLFSQTYTQISAGGEHSLALASDGNIYAWGNNESGQLGDGNGGFGVSDSAAVIVDNSGVLNGKTVTAIAAGYYSSLALTSEGKVYAWGSNDWGQLGDGNGGFGISNTSPIAVDISGVLNGKTVTQIATSGDHVMVLTSDGGLYGWGNNYDGQLGNGTNTDSDVPVAVDMSGALSGKTIVKLVVAYSHTLVLTADGGLYTWGSSEFGQLGDGSSGFGISSNVPVAVVMSGVLSGKTIVEIAAHTYHSLVTDSDGKIYAWGQNWVGQLGDDNGGFDVWTGEGSLSEVPVAVDMTVSLNGKSGSLVRAGGYHSLVLATDGSLHTFGSSELGQLGNSWYGFTVYADSSVSVDMNGVLSGKTITDISVGENHNLVLTSEGKIYGWGGNWMGQLGDGSFDDRSTPVVFDGGVVVAAPMLSVSTPLLDFELVEPLDSLDLSLVVKNTGTATLNVDSLRISTADSIRFLPDTTAPLSLAAGDSIKVNVRFKPQALGAFTAPLKIYSDGGDTSITITGTGGYEDFPLIKVRTGVSGALALTADGKVYSWGAGNALGVGDHLPFALFPVRVKGNLENKTVIDIESGFQHSVALTSEGEVYTWGTGYVGELGVGEDSTHSGLPSKVRGLLAGKTIVDIAGGLNHTLALSADGELFGWGMSLYGQLSIDEWVVGEPIQVSMDLGGRFIKEISAGYSHSMVLADDGTVFTFGAGAQLGQGNVTHSIDAQPVLGDLEGKMVRDISAGHSHSMAVTEGGDIYVWGVNESHVLGLGEGAPDTVKLPTRVLGLLENKKVVRTSGGVNHSLAITNGGELFSWGTNTYGNLGDGTTDTSKVPLLVSGDLSGKKVVDIDGSGVSVVLTQTGEVYTMGLAYLLGTGTFSENSHIPAYVFGTGGAPQLSVVETTLDFGEVQAGEEARLELTLSNTGDGGLMVDTPVISGTDASEFSVVGNALTIAASDSATISVGFKPTSEGTFIASLNLTSDGGDVSVSLVGKSVKTFIPIIAGFQHALGLGKDSLLFTWGSNYYGQLGTGDNNASNTPRAIGGDGLLAGKNLIDLTAGDYLSLALADDGTVYSWGYGSNLGYGSDSNSNVPVVVDTSGVLSGKKVTAISAGHGHVMALDSDGEAYAWGGNYYGNLGDGTSSRALSPVAVDVSGVLSGKVVAAIEAGGSFSTALTVTGEIFAWGLNASGQLGNGTNTNSNVPVAVDVSGVLSGKVVTAISAGSNHSLALTSDGKVFAWGSNSKGQLGDGSTTNSNIPIAVDMSGVLSGKVITAIQAGWQFSLVLTSEGRVYAWGSAGFNGGCVLGNGTRADSNVPVAVDMSGVLSGKKVVSIAAGADFSMAGTSDGKIYTWGANFVGQLGNGTYISSLVPVKVISPTTVSVSEFTSTPDNYMLYSNYPNPFNPTTTLRYDLPEMTDVSLSIYDIRGRMVTTMSEFSQAAGSYEVQWHGTDDFGNPVSTGVYLARIQAGRYSETIKMLYLK